MSVDRLDLDPAGLPSGGDALAVAVSGGADSFALLHAVVEAGWPVIALTVDHGLRPDAAAEAARVANWCATRNIPHETLVWRELPTNNLQASARTARYRLLCEACNRLGIAWLVTGHTADDQAETVFMRLRRGSGRGLAAMPPARKIAGGAGAPITLGRPLLGLRRRTTHVYAADHDLPVCSDPSNEDPTFERIRVRALLAALEAQDLMSVEALCRTAGEVSDLATQLRYAHDADEEDFEIAFEPDGSLWMWDSNWMLPDDLPPDVRIWFTNVTQHLWRRTLGAVGTVPSSHIGSLTPVKGSLSVSGTLVWSDGAGNVRILREPAALLGRKDGAGGFAPIPVAAGERLLFDRRFIIEAPQDIPPETKARPLGALLPRDIPVSTLDRQRISTLPVLCVGEVVTHLPIACVELVHRALGGWKSAREFLASDKAFDAECLIAERYLGEVIRF